jgi:hypothetical protein
MANTNKLPVACFAPPLSDETLAKYKIAIDLLPPEQNELKDAMNICFLCVEKWWDLPESTRKDVDRYNIVFGGKNTVFEVQPLEKTHIEELFSVTPWMRECNSIRILFDELPNNTKEEHELRNIAFHLLWHAMEISLDREPLTINKL